MKKIYILKTGSSYEQTWAKSGDYPQMIVRQAGLIEDQVEVVDVLKQQLLPDFSSCAAVVITGSHAMVTDNLPWSLAIEAWIRQSRVHNIPILGICYGHQLIAKAFGGIVDYHPQGIEIGTASVLVNQENQADDPLFADLPSQFFAHVTHSQSVRKLPQEAVHLAYNDFEANHAFRIGEVIWAVQFHPEFTTDVMQVYLEKQSAAIEKTEQGIPSLRNSVVETPEASGVLKRFAQLAGTLM